MTMKRQKPMRFVGATRAYLAAERDVDTRYEGSGESRTRRRLPRAATYPALHISGSPGWHALLASSTGRQALNRLAAR